MRWRASPARRRTVELRDQPYFRDTADYAIPGLRPGQYEVRFSAGGFRPRSETVGVPAGVRLGVDGADVELR